MLAALQRKFRRVKSKDSDEVVNAYTIRLRTIIADLRDENQALRKQLAGEWDNEHITVRHACSDHDRQVIGYCLNQCSAPATTAEVTAFYQSAVLDVMEIARQEFSVYEDSQS